jgi:signal transduction histidine kinase
LGDELLPFLLEAACVAFLLSLLLAWLISRWVTRPLRQLAQATQQVADGDFEQKVPREGPEEIRELEASFQEMTRRVKSSLKTQEELLANVSHELRTPLTSIRGFSQAILDGTAGSSEAVHQAAGVIQQEAERLQRLVEGLLDLARAQAGLAGLQRRRIDLRPEIQAALERFQPRAKDGGIRLSAQVDPLPSVMADSDRMAQVFDNLLDNAVRHTPNDGSIQLRAWPLQAEVHIQIRDSGPGIPPEALPRLFQRFFRADRGGRGAGLGLAICKEIVEAHRGTIEAANAPGGGAVFTVHLPIAPPEGTTLVIRRRSS